MAEEAVIVTVPPDTGPVDGPIGHGQSLQDRRKSLELNRIEAEKELELIRQKYKDKKGMDFFNFFVFGPRFWAMFTVKTAEN